jgi:cytochrome P450
MNLVLVTLFLTLLVINLIKAYLKFKKRVSKLPPILPGSFFSGNYSALDTKNIHLKLTSIGSDYGDLFTIRVFYQHFVVLNSYQSINSILCSKNLEAAGRSDQFLIRVATNGFKDLVFTAPNTRWLQTRNLFHKFFSDMKKLHDRVDFSEIVFLEEWPSLFASLNSQTKSENMFDFKSLITLFQSRILCTILFGHDVTNNQNIMNRIIELDKKSKKIISNLYKIKLNMNPIEVLFGSKNFNLLHESLSLQKMIMNEIFEFKSSNRSSQKTNLSHESSEICVKSLFDLFISMKEIDKSVMDCVHMKNVLTEVIFAGIETIANTVNTFFYYMCLFPDIQKKVFSELNELNCENVSLANRKLLPYVQACIYESQRIVTLIPLGIFRKTLSDIEYANYFLPKGTVLIPNLWKLMHDEKVYPDPYSFKPERFMTNSNELVDFCDENFKRLMIFGCGKRACPGKSVSQNLIFLFIVNILRLFEVEFDSKVCDSHFDQDPRSFEFGSTLEPPDFTVKLSRRETSCNSLLSLDAATVLCDFSSSCSSTRRRSEIKALCTDRLSFIESLREATMNDNYDKNPIYD